MGEAIAELTLMIQDALLDPTGGDVVEKKRLRIDDDTFDRFLDGPACRRVAVVDFDPATGGPLPSSAEFTAFKPERPTRGRYDTADLPRDSAAFLAVNTFGTVFETIRMFEERAALGRRVEWAFDGEQLLVVPRAGRWANAFYERATRSLQFFWFEANGEKIFTALSRDIVAHECGHALLDAVVPSLYDAVTPESIAIHEALADLVAVLMALRCAPLRTKVLRDCGNSIADATSFSWIAEQFGSARPSDEDPHPQALRNLLNDETMSSVGREPHTLSTVLSAVLYESLVDMFDAQKDRVVTAAGGDPTLDAARAANRALGSSGVIFRRLLLRGIDYLPPGELTFADVGRAILAADRAAVPDVDDDAKAAARQRFAERFVQREIVADVAELDSPSPHELSVDPQQLADLVASDWESYRFVEANRALIGVPPDVPFKVLPRVDATKEIGRRRSDNRGYATQRELIMKVGWEHVEANSVDAIPSPQRRVATGATLAWRWDDGAIVALVRSDVIRDELRAERDRMLAELADDDLVTVVEPGHRAIRQGAPSSVDVRLTGGIARITGTHRLLHIVER